MQEIGSTGLASRGSWEEEPQEQHLDRAASDGLRASPQMFPSVVFKSGNNGPLFWEGPRVVPQIPAAWAHWEGRHFLDWTSGPWTGI